ncbi:type II 3-dehydroquinate dehydratase [Desulfohalovibrio reitneri]|uniref:type II 3-dehydroquinate dehydratase n=1 Tax=Desulfohalovibrio reitneri TaxID=1307759 RepID=UPI0004A6C1C7|nr:type II 3-dehydroquinate dehydratase [Desulfohalovibrio reitneri]
MHRFLVVNGPNLGHLGVRQPDIYGTRSMDDLPGILRGLLGERAETVKIEIFQANGEGEIIDRLERAREEGIDGLVLNAGAYTHTSLALADCLAWIGLPCVEVHLSNVLARTEEPLRQITLTGKHCLGVVAGFGLDSYALAVAALLRHMEQQ